QAAQNPIADVLVEWHAAAECTEAGRHAAAEDRISSALAERRNQHRQLLRRVLAVPVHHGHEVEPLRNRKCVADLLIAAVALVVGITEHRYPDVRMLLSVLVTDLERAVL